jgi:phosphatidylethanolamine/phosphatidyl-N-methylethanolamine N-methyltransferase
MLKRDLPYRENALLRWSYSLIAPIYDLVVSRPLLRARTLSIDNLPTERARPRSTGLQVEWVLGDSMALPFANAYFDHIVLHLILAVVPQSALCLSEAARVLKPGGTIIIFDKFLRPKQTALLRRALNPLLRRFATRMDVVFEEVLQRIPSLQFVSDVPLLAGGWFRGIVLKKN